MRCLLFIYKYGRNNNKVQSFYYLTEHNYFAGFFLLFLLTPSFALYPPNNIPIIAAFQKELEYVQFIAIY